MWRTIFVSKSSVKQFNIIQKPKVGFNISLKNNDVSLNKFLSVYTFKNLNKSPINTINCTQFERTFVSKSGNANQKSLKEPLNSPGEQKQKPESKYDFEQIKKLFAVFLSGCAAYFAITYALDMNEGRKKSNQMSNDDVINYESKNLPGRVKISKSIRREKNPGNIKITLYQIVTCPFCCKVRAYLDYYGYSYDIVEVNSLTKSQLDWSNYKKSPTIVIQIPSKDRPNEYEQVIEQLNDSSVIISALETFRIDQAKAPIRQIKSYYEPAIIDETDKKKSKDYLNKYFIMLYNEKLYSSKNAKERKEERQWRRWVDEKFIHVISPNVYRTLKETTDAFDWYKKVGDWESQFSKIEIVGMYYAGVIVMYLLSIYLKRKYELKSDPRESLYDLCNEWCASLSDAKPLQGGATPNLADLNLYGVIQSFEGTQTFEDMMKNTKIKSWYDIVKEDVEFNNGRFILNTPLKVKPSNDYDCTEPAPPRKKRFFFF